MKRVAIIGGGVSGLSAAVTLAKQSQHKSGQRFHITILESLSKLGGRVYSFTDKNFSKPIDNGQHIMMGCYRETISYCRQIGSMDKLLFQENLSIPFIAYADEITLLQAPALPYPLNLLWAMLSYRGLDIISKWKLIGFLMAMKFSNRPLSWVNESAAEWLERFDQTPQICSALWNILVVGILNTKPEIGSARLFEKVLREIFFTDSFSSTMVVPKTDLSDVLINPAIEYLGTRGGSVRFNERILAIEENNATLILTNCKGHTEIFDAVIFAIPLFALRKIEGIFSFITLPENDFDYSPIISFHFELKHNPLKEKYYALLASPIEWVFNHGSHISTVTSAATAWIGKSQNELLPLFKGELKKYFGISEDDIIAYRMVKEKRATFVPDIETESKRKKIMQCSLGNVYLAGDWTNTGLPATIEGAILSGKIAAERLL